MTGVNLFFEYLTDGWQVLVLAAVPLSELRLALPLGLTVFNLPILKAYVLAVIGNILPVIFLIYLLPPSVVWFRKNSEFCDKFFTWWFERVVKNYEAKFARWGMFALLLFVAIPLPMTGAWTGSVAVYLFKLPKNLSFIYITIGVMISGIIVTVLTIGGTKLF